MTEKFNNWFRTSITLKLIIIGILILVLLIPVNMAQQLIHERQTTLDSTKREVASKWGLDQTIGTPVISIPYETFESTSDHTKQSFIRYAHILPDDITIETELTPKERSRGRYEVVLYNCKASIKGTFSSKIAELQKLTRNTLHLDQAFIQLGITDLKGVQDGISFKTDSNETYEFNPGINVNDIYQTGISVPFDMTDRKDFSFECSINLNGSSSVYFQPYGKETKVNLKTPWTNPGFAGSFLPDVRHTDEKGTTASWKILQLNRNYPQYGLGNFIRRSETVTSDQDGVTDSSFGVRLLLPVDEYQKTNRSAKYAAMFIILTIISFFFIEIIHKKPVHPIQYLLIGFGIVLFYILLLSISEQLNFDAAYWIACSAIILLISLYTQSVFRRLKITVLICSILTTLYAFFYSLLQLQDYALLMGSIGLFIILAVTMYLTRNIDWYKNKTEKDGTETPLADQ